MSAIEIVKRNTFYKKQNITTGINIKPEFKDLAEAADELGSKTFKLSAGSNSNMFVLSGSSPDLPPYGAGDLSGGFLSVFCVESSGNSARENPNILLYKLNPEVTLAEGSYNLATRSGSTAADALVVGDKVSIYNSRPASMVPKRGENFEGNESLSTITRMGSNSTVTYSDPYITPENLQMYLRMVGLYTNTKEFNRFVENCVGVDLTNHGPRFDRTKGLKLSPFNPRNDHMVPYTLTGKDGGTVSGKGRAFRLQRADHKTQGGQRTNYRLWGMVDVWNHSFPLVVLDELNMIDFIEKTSAGTELDSNPGANTSNTIFDDIAATKNMTNPYEATEDSPLILSELSLSSEQSTNEGQSLKFYHNWGHSEYNNLIQNDLGGDNNLNPQVLRASMYNIPMPPLMFDVGASQVNNESNIDVYGSMQAVVPEIQMKMFVNKLSPNVPLNISGGSNYATTAVRPFSTYAGEGAGTIAKTAFTDTENSFLRSITVTFSNYRPKSEHNTLDEFLQYGLHNFYQGENDDNIVGGYTINTFGSSLTNALGGENPTVAGSAPDMWAAPLPVCKINQLAGATGTPANAPAMLLSGGISQLSGANDLSALNKLAWGVTPTWGGSHVASRFLPMQKLPMQSWINNRIFTDIQAHNNSGSCTPRPYAPSTGTSNPSTNDITTSGVPMRVIFETSAGTEGFTGGSGSLYSFSQLGATQNDVNTLLPFLDIFFPVTNTVTPSTDGTFTSGDKTVSFSSGSAPLVRGMRLSQSTGTAGAIVPSGAVVESINAGVEGVSVTSFEMSVESNSSVDAPFLAYSGPADGVDYTFDEKPEWFPSIMTIWVQNYPWTTGSASGDFKNADNIWAPSGTATETEMFLDDINLMNYGPEVLNMTANAGNSNISFKPARYTGPYAAMVSGNSATSFDSGKFKRGWVQSDPLVNEVTLCSLESGSSQVKLLLESGAFDAGRLENAAARNADFEFDIKITGTGIPANTYVKLLDSSTLDMTDNSNNRVLATTTSAATNVTFNSSGTLQPVFNKANLHTFDVGSNMCLGFDNKADLPLSNSTHGSDAGGYILFNNFNTDSMTTVQENPLKPDKITHLYRGAGGYQLGGVVSQSSGTANVKTLGSQLYAPTYYVEGTTTTSNISGAAMRVVDSGAHTTIVFTGGGLNDMTANGTVYNQETDKSYEVEVDGVGTPNTFKWSDDGGVSYEATAVNMAATNTLNNGITISWGALTGHTVGNKWAFTAQSVARQQNGIAIPTGSSAFMNNDGFRQKGFIKLSVGPQVFGWNTTAYSGWEYRENILASTKVVGTGSKSSLIVEDTSIFNYNNPDERYILYVMGADMDGATAVNRSAKTLLQLDIDVPISGTEVTFTSDCTFANDGTSLITTDKMMPRLWISPQKYWLNMTFDTPSTISPRNYENACTINQTPTVSNFAGTTFSEYVYSYATGSTATGGLSGKYTKEWDLTPALDSETVITNQDFGEGILDEDNPQGGALAMDAIINNSFLHLDVTPAVTDSSTQPNDNFPMALYYQPTDFELTNFSTFEEDDSTTTEKRPTLYWKYTDHPPDITNLSVAPAYDLLAKDTNLYELTNEDLNAVRFSWQEDNADDIWYRMLMVDDNIDSKYHKAKLWIPLNEAVVPTPAPAYTYHNVTAQTSGAATVGPDVRGVIEGQAGYAAKLSASTAESGSIIIPKGVNTALTNESEFTLVAHWTPSAADNNAISYVANQTTALGTAAGNFELFKDASDKIVARLGANIALTGTTTILCDETTPTSIIMTLNTGSSNPEKAKLYINGVLEDTSTGSTLQTTSADFTLGGSGTSTYRTTTGLLEEIIVYTKAWEIPETSNEYVFSTVDLLDSDASNDRNITHSARLFAMDYHNIRGYSKKDLGLSQSIGWRATTV